MKNSKVLRYMELTKKFAYNEEFQEYISLFNFNFDIHYNGDNRDRFKTMLREQHNAILNDENKKARIDDE